MALISRCFILGPKRSLSKRKTSGLLSVKLYFFIQEIIIFNEFVPPKDQTEKNI